MMAQLGKQSILSLDPSASYQSIGDGAVILRVDDGQLYTCNVTSEAFLRQVDGNRTLAEIASSLCEEFDVDPDVVTADLIGIAHELLEEGILRRIG